MIATLLECLTGVCKGSGIPRKMPESVQTTGFQSKHNNRDHNSDSNYFEGKIDLIKDGGTLKYC